MSKESASKKLPLVHFFKVFFFFFLLWVIFEVFIEFVTILFRVFGFLAARHRGSELPDQGSDPHFLHWQVESYPLDHQGTPTIF